MSVLKEATEEILDGASVFAQLAVFVALKAALIELDPEAVHPELEKFLGRVEQLTIEFLDHIALDDL